MRVSKEFLPFTRPSIDEETIERRGRGAALGLDHQRAAGARIRERAVGLLRRPPGARLQLRHRRRWRSDLHWPASARATRSSPRPLSWVATANVILRAGARAGVRRHRSAHPQYRSCSGSRPRSRRARGRCCRWIWPACRSIASACTPSRASIGCACSRMRRRPWARAGTGERIGAIGDLVSISFHANKNITTAEGGCLVLNDEDEAQRCELWRLQGVERFPDGGLDATLPGGKYNLTDVAARIGLGQLTRLEQFTARRRALARRYFERFDRSARAASCRSRISATATGTCSRSCCRRSVRARRVHCTRCRRPASASACTIRRFTC